VVLVALWFFILCNHNERSLNRCHSSHGNKHPTSYPALIRFTAIACPEVVHISKIGWNLESSSMLVSQIVQYAILTHDPNASETQLRSSWLGTCHCIYRPGGTRGVKAEWQCARCEPHGGQSVPCASSWALKCSRHG
jgi:hypothetical protein